MRSWDKAVDMQTDQLCKRVPMNVLTTPGPGCVPELELQLRSSLKVHEKTQEAFNLHKEETGKLLNRAMNDLVRKRQLTRELQEALDAQIFPYDKLQSGDAVQLEHRERRKPDRSSCSGTVDLQSVKKPKTEALLRERLRRHGLLTLS